MYVYIQSEKHLWTVGFYDPQELFQTDSDHDSKESAAKRAHYLNGGNWTIIGLNVEGERILTDEQLVELHNDIRDGRMLMVSTEYRDQFDAAVRKLLAWFPDINKEGCVIDKEITISTPFVEILREVIRLLGPEPKDPPKETQ